MNAFFHFLTVCLDLIEVEERGKFCWEHFNFIMITIAMHLLIIIGEWLNIVNLYLRLINTRSRIRQWWVKPHITVAMRELFGAYQTLFFLLLIFVITHIIKKQNFD